MKKFYTFALAALCSVGAYATEASEIVGSYDWSYYSEINEDNFKGLVEVSLGDEANTVNLHFQQATEFDEEGLDFVAKGVWNSDFSTITIAPSVVGAIEFYGSSYDLNFAAAEIIVTEYYSEVQALETPVVATYDAETKTISFGETMLGVFIVEDEFTDPLMVTSSNVLQSQAPVSEWTELGTGKFFDGVICPFFGMAKEDVLVQDVKIYEKNDAPGLYKVQAPWAYIIGGNADLIIDLTDPTYGLIDLFNTGADYLHGDVFVQSVSSYMKSSGFGKAQFLAYYSKYNISYNESTKTINMPGNSCFVGWPTSSEAAYKQMDSAKNPYAGYIQLPTPAAIDGIAVNADENAPVEYFNLQGVKLANPEAGQVVIRRQGSNVSKIYVK